MLMGPAVRGRPPPSGEVLAGAVVVPRTPSRPSAGSPSASICSISPCGSLDSLGGDVLVEAHALLRDRGLVDDDLLLVEHDLVLLLGDLGAGRGCVAVGVGDRLALDANLLALHRNGLGHVLGDDVLDQARRPVSRWVVPTRSSSSERVIAASVSGPLTSCRPCRRCRVRPCRLAALGQPAVGARLGVVEAVVRVERRLVALGELAVGLHLRGVLHLLPCRTARGPCRHRRRALRSARTSTAAEHPGVDSAHSGRCGLGVEVDLLDLADLAAVGGRPWSGRATRGLRLSQACFRIPFVMTHMRRWAAPAIGPQRIKTTRPGPAMSITGVRLTAYPRRCRIRTLSGSWSYIDDLGDSGTAIAIRA